MHAYQNCWAVCLVFVKEFWPGGRFIHELAANQLKLSRDLPKKFQENLKQLRNLETTEERTLNIHSPRTEEFGAALHPFDPKYGPWTKSCASWNDWFWLKHLYPWGICIYLILIIVAYIYMLYNITWCRMLSIDGSSQKKTCKNYLVYKYTYKSQNFSNAFKTWSNRSGWSWTLSVTCNHMSTSCPQAPSWLPSTLGPPEACPQAFDVPTSKHIKPEIEKQKSWNDSERKLHRFLYTWKLLKAKSKSQQSVILTRQVVGHLNILTYLSISCSTIGIHNMTSYDSMIPYHCHIITVPIDTYRIAGRLTLRLGNCTLWSRVARNTQNARIHTIVWAYLRKISRSQNDAKWNRMKMPQDRSFRLLGNAEVLRRADKNDQKS